MLYNGNVKSLASLPAMLYLSFSMLEFISFVCIKLDKGTPPNPRSANGLNLLFCCVSFGNVIFPNSKEFFISGLLLNTLFIVL